MPRVRRGIVAKGRRAREPGCPLADRPDTLRVRWVTGTLGSAVNSFAQATLAKFCPNGADFARAGASPRLSHQPPVITRSVRKIRERRRRSIARCGYPRCSQNRVAASDRGVGHIGIVGRDLETLDAADRFPASTAFRLGHRGAGLDRLGLFWRGNSQPARSIAGTATQPPLEAGAARFRRAAGRPDRARPTPLSALGVSDGAVRSGAGHRAARAGRVLAAHVGHQHLLLLRGFQVRSQLPTHPGPAVSRCAGQTRRPIDPGLAAGSQILRRHDFSYRRISGWRRLLFSTNAPSGAGRGDRHASAADSDPRAARSRSQAGRACLEWVFHRAGDVALSVAQMPVAQASRLWEPARRRFYFGIPARRRCHVAVSSSNHLARRRAAGAGVGRPLRSLAGMGAVCLAGRADHGADIAPGCRAARRFA